MPEMTLGETASQPVATPKRLRITAPRATAPQPNGRPPFEPTQQHRQLVTVFRSVGVDPADIAAQLGIAEKTLRKHFKTEMAMGKAQIVARIGAKCVQKALAGDNGMIVFYLRNHGGDAWRDKQTHELTGPGGTPLLPPNLVIGFMASKPDGDATS